MNGEDAVVEIAAALEGSGVKKFDALHLACAMFAKADYFLTTDDGIIKKAESVQTVRVTDPISFIKEIAA